MVSNAFHLPYGLSCGDFHNQLKENAFVIYSGQGTFAKSIFRVSTMRAISRQEMQRLIAVVNQIMVT